jgi:hypothetical protein
VKVLGPVLAQSGRLVFIASGGWYLTTHEGTAVNFFALAASSMVLLGVLSTASVVLTRWGPKRVAGVPMRASLARKNVVLGSQRDARSRAR